MGALAWTDYAELIMTYYGALITETLVKTGFGNDGMIVTSPSARLRDNGRVFVGGADGNDKNPRDWAMHYGGASAASYGVNDAYPAATQEDFLNLILAWKRVGVSMSYDNLVRLTQKGGNRGGINMVSADLRYKLKELMDEIDEELVTDGTGNSSKDITGFLAFLSTSNTYAGQAQGTYATLQAALSNASSASLSKALLRGLLRTLKDRNAFDDGPMEMWMPGIQYHKFLEIYEDNIRYVPGGEASDRVRPIFSDGSVDLNLFEVRGVPTSEIWFINPQTVELRFVDHAPDDELGDADETVFYEGVPLGIEPVYQNKDIKSFFLKAYPQLVCVKPYTQGRLYGLATS